jgi:hypothetical protein
MPLILAPIVPFALRLGAVAAAGFAVKRIMAARVHQGRTDQRGEDALDDLGEGVAVHRPKDQTECRQRNTSLRIKRIIRWGKGGFEIDAAMLGRFRIRKL